MKKAISLFLALILCVSLAVPALAASTETVKNGGVEITFNDVVRTVTRTIKLDKGDWNVSDEEILIYILPDNGTSILIESDGSSGSIIEYLYVETDGIYTILGAGMSEYNPYEVAPNPNIALTCIRAYGSDTVYAYYTFESSPLADNALPVATAMTPAPAAPIVQRSPQNVTVDGKAVTPDIYNINDRNYFKLRDLAALLNGTSAQFEVGYNDATKTISITTGAAYTPVGGELAAGEDKSATCVESAQALEINGTVASLTAYNIGGNNYFQLRELGAALGFGVDYDAATNTAIITSK